MDVKDFGRNVKNEGFFADALIDLVDELNMAVHLPT